MKRTVLSLVTAGVLSLSAMSMAFAADLPQVKILATGGTIAGSAASKTQVTGYQAGAIGIETLIEAVPEMKDFAEVSGEQISNVGSMSITGEIWLQLARRCNELLADPKVKGVVITHGTDTLEETAYFLNLTVKSDKPVVIVGAMRPATAISADGPVNLLNAVKLATSPKAVGMGVMVAMNDEINGARDVTKTNTSNVATFTSRNLGALGVFTGGEPYFYKQSLRRHTVNSEFDVSKIKELPRVDIIYTHIDDDRTLIDAAVNAGAKGIIYTGAGMGSIHKKSEPGLAEAAQKGVVVVRTSRTGSGMTIATKKQYTDEKIMNGDTLNAQKARVLLQLALTKTSDPEEVQRIFNEY